MNIIFKFQNRLNEIEFSLEYDKKEQKEIKFIIEKS